MCGLHRGKRPVESCCAYRFIAGRGKVIRFSPMLRSTNDYLERLERELCKREHSTSPTL